jgi:hypothetical protein
MGKKVLKTKIFFWVLMWPSIINKISEHKFQSLLYGTFNTKFQNVFFCNMLLIYVVYINKKKKCDRSVRKKQLFIEIESLKIDEKVNIFKIAISHF